MAKSADCSPIVPGRLLRCSKLRRLLCRYWRPKSQCWKFALPPCQQSGGSPGQDRRFASAARPSIDILRLDSLSLEIDTDRLSAQRKAQSIGTGLPLLRGEPDTKAQLLSGWDGDRQWWKAQQLKSRCTTPQSNRTHQTGPGASVRYK